MVPAQGAIIQRSDMDMWQAATEAATTYEKAKRGL